MGRLVALCLAVITVFTGAAWTAANAAPAPPNQQVARGGQLFANTCAKCHGQQGQGSKKGPMLVGQGALPLAPRPKARIRKVQFRTANDVLGWASVHMPADDPGSLKADEYAAILAFLLHQNGFDVKNIRVDKKSAANIRLH